MSNFLNSAESASGDRPAARPAGLPLSNLVLGALLVSAAVYLRAAFFEFAYDDFGQIAYNPQIKSWALALSYFKSHVWAQSSNIGLYYRPLFMLWLTANYKLFGLNPLYWHIAVIALHLLCCLLMYRLVLRLTRDNWVSTVAMLLFGLHPVHVESVAWVSGATDPLMAAFLLASLLCYLIQRDSVTRRAEWRAASLFLAVLAVFTKETAIIIPALIFAYQWIFPECGISTQLGRTGRTRMWSAIRTAIPYVEISVVFLLARTFALKSLTPARGADFQSIILAWPEIISFYIAHGLFPVGLSVFYDLQTVTHPGFRNFVLPLLFTLTGVVVLLYASWKSPVWAFLSAWCAIMLIPMLNVTLFSSVENIHDRYLYLPSIAICTMLALLLSHLKRWHSWAAGAAVAVLAVGYASATVLELPHWQDDNILAQHGIATSPGHPIALQLAGNVLIRQQRIVEAIPYLVDSMNAQPNNVDTLCSLAFSYSEMNALPLAEESVAKAMAIDPKEPRAHLILGIIRLKQKRLDEAGVEIRRGIALQHVSTGVMLFHYYLGEVLYAKGDVPSAIGEYRLELLNDPSIDPAVPSAQARIDLLRNSSGVESPRHQP